MRFDPVRVQLPQYEAVGTGRSNKRTSESRETRQMALQPQPPVVTTRLTIVNEGSTWSWTLEHYGRCCSAARIRYRLRRSSWPTWAYGSSSPRISQSRRREPSPAICRNMGERHGPALAGRPR